MRAILIDPWEQSIKEIDTTGKLKELYKLMKCSMVEAVHLKALADSTMLVDEEGLLGENQMEVMSVGYPHTVKVRAGFILYGFEYVGRAVILGSDEYNGDWIDCKLKMEDLFLRWTVS